MASSMSARVPRSNLIIMRRFLLHPRGNLRNKSSLEEFEGNVRLRRVKDSTIEPHFTSLSTKGFLRAAKAYEPPKNVAEKVLQCLAAVLPQEIHVQDVENVQLSPRDRFNFLTECIRQFQHDIPNSQLHKMRTVGDAVSYFKMDVKTTTPYDELLRMEEKPGNLHVQPDFLRFHPDTDALFKGKTAFPGNSTVVTGLKYRKKYKGFVSKLPSPTT